MPTCPICGTEIKEGAGFCPRCWRRLVGGQGGEGKNKKRLAAIIIPCVAAIIVVILFATRILPLSSGQVAEVPYAGVSAYDLGKELFAPQLTDLQRHNLWKDYTGKQVEWTSELEYVSEEGGGLTAYFLNPLDFARTEVVAVFDESQRLSLLQLGDGDLITYTGVLASFGQSSIGLTDCTVVSQALEPLWWDGKIDTFNQRILTGDDVLCLGPSTYGDATEVTEYALPKITVINKQTGKVLWQDQETGSTLVGIDSRYVYAWHPVKIVPMSQWDQYFYWYSSNITALDEATGQVGWDSWLAGGTHCESQTGCLPNGWTLSDYVGCCILQGSVKLEITDKGGAELAFLIDKPPLSQLSYEYQGVVYRSACAVYGGIGRECGALQAVDKTTGDVLWMMTFGDTGMNDFSIDIVAGILYVSTDKGVGAFEL
jgi:hypothetical protein